MNKVLERKSIKDKREDLLSRIERAALWTGRRKDEVTFVAVSKQQPNENVAEALAAGHYVFGENKVQEARVRWQDHFGEARENIELRLIGPLQTNKAKDAVALFDVIETLDRPKLAAAICKAIDQVGRVPELFVQVNIGSEVQKSGVSVPDLPLFLDQLRQEYQLRISGLMCIPPQNEASSPYFWLLRRLAEDHGIGKLSMGMSSDFETAIKMGSTHVRIGSAFLGQRA